MFEWLKAKKILSTLSFGLLRGSSAPLPQEESNRSPFQRSEGSPKLRSLKYRRLRNRSREIMARRSRKNCFSTRRKRVL